MKANQWKNWGGNVAFQARKLRFPKSEEKIQSIVRKAGAKSRNVRVCGSGHSWTDLCKTDGDLISLDKMQGVISVDKEKMHAEVWAGTKIKALTEELHKFGMAMENLGDIDVQSIAGAIGTGTHGTGMAFGNLSTQIAAITFVNGKGELINCSEEENREIFKAAQISMGALGIITRVTIKCLKAYKLELVEQKENAFDCLVNLEEYNANNRNFEFYWFPYTEVVQTKFSNITEQPIEDNSMVNYVFNDIILENGVLDAFSRVTKYVPNSSKTVAKISGAVISAGKKRNWSHRVYATARLVKFMEMEYNIPIENFRDCFMEIKELFEKRQYNIHFPTENRFVKGDDIYLSPAYERDSAYIAAHVYQGKAYRRYFDDLESIYKNHDGRPHWGKMHFRTAEDFMDLYPKWFEFLDIREMMDPDGVFLSPYLKALFGITG